mmetsp:Transcript_1999/g.5695  ORF Transcript_1999/g.5695 Transcript_1999/m.5695 type:complete len:95 (-) Transcript_1999:151-435(-)
MASTSPATSGGFKDLGAMVWFKALANACGQMVGDTVDNMPTTKNMGLVFSAHQMVVAVWASGARGPCRGADSTSPPQAQCTIGRGRMGNPSMLT